MMSEWPKAGDKMRFLDENGYPFQREEARKIFTKDQVLTVEDFNLGDWHSEIKFKEAGGWFNHVMFERMMSEEHDESLWRFWNNKAREQASTITALTKRAEEAERERDEVLQAPWPQWAESILKTLQSYGYDPVENGEVDLADAFNEYMIGVNQEDEFQRKQIETLTSRATAAERRLAEAERVIAPFAALASGYDQAFYGDEDIVNRYRFVPSVGELRAARKWQEEGR